MGVNVTEARLQIIKKLNEQKKAAVDAQIELKDNRYNSIVLLFKVFLNPLPKVWQRKFANNNL